MSSLGRLWTQPLIIILGSVNPVNYVASADGEHYFVFSEGYLTETQMGSIHL